MLDLFANRVLGGLLSELSYLGGLQSFSSSPSRTLYPLSFSLSLFSAEIAAVRYIYRLKVGKSTRSHITLTYALLPRPQSIHTRVHMDVCNQKVETANREVCMQTQHFASYPRGRRTVRMCIVIINEIFFSTSRTTPCSYVWSDDLKFY